VAAIMRRFLVFCLPVILSLIALTPAYSQQIRSGATVYIEPMDGFEGYLASAFLKRHIPLIVVDDRSKADYVVKAKVSRKDTDQAGNNSVVINNDNGQRPRNSYGAMLDWTEANIVVVDVKSSAVVFADAAGNAGSLQVIADSCAKGLKKFLDKGR
jgi:hypothetical protein